MSYATYAALRDRAGLTDHAVAQAIGAGSATIYDWRNGKTSPKLDKLLKIADVLGVKLEDLISDEVSGKEK